MIIVSHAKEEEFCRFSQMRGISDCSACGYNELFSGQEEKYFTLTCSFCHHIMFFNSPEVK